MGLFFFLQSLFVKIRKDFYLSIWYSNLRIFNKILALFSSDHLVTPTLLVEEAAPALAVSSSDLLLAPSPSRCCCCCFCCCCCCCRRPPSSFLEDGRREKDDPDPPLQTLQWQVLGQAPPTLEEAPWNVSYDFIGKFACA